MVVTTALTSDNIKYLVILSTKRKISLYKLVRNILEDFIKREKYKDQLMSSSIKK